MPDPEQSQHHRRLSRGEEEKTQDGRIRRATCSRCELPLDPAEGTCPNDRCPFHFGLQDEVIDDEGHPSEEEWRYIAEIRARLDSEA